MNIALINYEYPPDIADGGIATYVRQAARMLAARGHRVEVFAASRHRSGTCAEDGVTVHRTQVNKEIDFPTDIVGIFNERHKHKNFDVIEGPEFRAYARGVVDEHPEIPYAVRLHTPHSVLARWEEPASRLSSGWLRTKIGELRRGINPFEDLERKYALKADLLASPSEVLRDLLIKEWKLNPDDVVKFPLPYIPSSELLAIPAETHTNTVTFLGRLEVRKGVIELARAIPLILERHPNARFRFVGKSCVLPNLSSDARQYLLEVLGESRSSVEFVEQVPLDRIPEVFEQTDICVFPSRFDSFGLVCLEAMAAARGVVGSSASGMAEILNTPNVGVLVPPEDPSAIASAVAELLEDPERRIRMGAAARQRVLAEYNADRVGEQHERFYAEAIGRRQRSATFAVTRPVKGAVS